MKRRTRTSPVGRTSFTIIELIVVTVMISILATMIVPRLSGSMRSTRLRESSRSLVTTAQYARDLAATRRRTCRLMIDVKGGRYSLALESNPGREPGKFSPLRSGVGKVQRLPDGVRFGKVLIEPFGQRNSAQRSDTYIAFGTTGRTDAAAVQITNGRRTYSLLVAPCSGQVRLVEAAVDELPTNRRDLDE